MSTVLSVSPGPHPHPLHGLLTKLTTTMQSTSKSDKYLRLASNMMKYVRAMSSQKKAQYSKVYKQLLVARQVIRWNGIYQSVKEMYEGKEHVWQLQRLPTLLFILLEVVGDLLDRAIFVLEILNRKQLQSLLSKIDQLQSNCYFLQCIIWLIHHLTTLKKVLETGSQQDKFNKILKIAKYFCDSLTSYCKFSRRVWELQPKTAAVVGIISSVVGVYDLLK